MDSLTDPDPDEEVQVLFAPSYQLEWLLGCDVDVIFTPEGWDE